MPIYEYKCRKCGKEFELFQRMTDPVLKSCQYCKGPVQKLMSLSSFHLKGSGWYVTDYAGKKPSTGEAKHEETSAPKAAESSTETSTAASPAPET